MSYKDKDKQREAQREWVRQKRKGSTEQGSTITKCDTHPKVIPEDTPIVMLCEAEPVIPKQATPVVTEFTKTKLRKRGKDIKVFADLPPDIQQTINTISENEAEHKRRTAIAINYQHQFPDRYHSTGVV